MNDTILSSYAGRVASTSQGDDNTMNDSTFDSQQPPPPPQYPNRPRRPSPDTIAYLRSLPLETNIETVFHDIQKFQEQQQQQSINNKRRQQQQKHDADAADTADEDEEMEFPMSLAVAFQAIYEIRNEIASLAGDEYGAEMLELLCTIGIPNSATICRIVLDGINRQNYAVHLATHRYGSHVLQTILQLSTIHCSTDDSTVEKKKNDDDDEDQNTDLALYKDAPMIPNIDATTTATRVMDLILPIASSLHAVATELLVHICGSHCLRTILCILGGVTMMTQNSSSSSSSIAGGGSSNNFRSVAQQLRRGKVKPKKKKRKVPTTMEEHDSGTTSRNPCNEPRMIYPLHRTIPTSGMIDLLHQYTESLTGRIANDDLRQVLPDGSNDTDGGSSEEMMVGPGQLQSWVCHASAGPVIAVLVQVWTYFEYGATTGTSSMNGNSISHHWETLRQQQLQWEIQQTTPDRHIFMPRPEPKYIVGSVTDRIVRRILCWRNEKEKQTYGADVIYGYAGEPRGSHCLETIFRVTPDAIYEQMLHCSTIYDVATMKEYIHDTVSNFVLQTILQTIRTSHQATLLLKAIEPHMSFIVNPINKRRWIVWRMVELAVSYDDCQRSVIHMITDGFTNLLSSNADNSSSSGGKIATSDTVTMKLNKVIGKLLNVTPPAQYGDRVGVDIAGTRIIYHLLQFEPELCKDTIKGIMELSSNDIELLMKDPFASRCIFDEMMTSNVNGHHAIFINARRRLVTKIQNRWVNVATDRVGYHVITKLFMSLDDMNDKKLLVDELLVGKNRMNSNSMGRNVLDALHVRVYETDGENEWMNTIKRQISKQEWLNEIIDTEKKATDHSTSGSVGAVDNNTTKRNNTATSLVDNTFNKKKQKFVSKSVDTIMDAMSIPTQQ